MRATTAERSAIRRAVAEAEPERLALWLSPSDDWPDLMAKYDTIPCPHCQRDRGAPMRNGPSAYLDPLGLTWWCSGCRRRGTRFGLELSVLEDPRAVALVVAEVLAEGIRA